MKGENRMCFIKSKSVKVPKKAVQNVVRHQADADTTKTSLDENRIGYKENIKTSVIGLTDDAVTDKKTLLGE